MKICLFRATNILKHNVKEKWLYSGYGIAFNGKCEWKCGNDFARNVIIFSVDKSSSSQTDYLRKKLSALNRRPTYCINGSVGEPSNKFNINFSEAITKCCLFLC